MVTRQSPWLALCAVAAFAVQGSFVGCATSKNRSLSSMLPRSFSPLAWRSSSSDDSDSQANATRKPSVKANVASSDKASPSEIARNAGKTKKTRPAPSSSEKVAANTAPQPKKTTPAKNTPADEPEWSRGGERSLFAKKKAGGDELIEDPFLASSSEPLEDDNAAADDGTETTIRRDRLRDALTADAERSEDFLLVSGADRSIRLKVDALMQRARACETQDDLPGAVRLAKLATDLSQHSALDFAPDEDRPADLLFRIQQQLLADDDTAPTTSREVAASTNEPAWASEASPAEHPEPEHAVWAHDPEEPRITANATAQSKVQPLDEPSEPQPRVAANRADVNRREPLRGASPAAASDSRAAWDQDRELAQPAILPAIELGFSELDLDAIDPPQLSTPNRDALALAATAPRSARNDLSVDAPPPPIEQDPVGLLLSAPQAAEGEDIDFDEVFSEFATPQKSSTESDNFTGWFAAIAGLLVVCGVITDAVRRRRARAA